jgi:hypothetical protein
MKTVKIVRSLAVAGALTFILVSAARSAAANVGTALKATELVDGSQRRMRISITPVIANNDINLAQKNKAIEVAIIGEPTWDFTDIDPQTVEFAGAIPARSSYKSTDVDNDGQSDRIYSFTTSQLKLTPADTMACMKLETLQKLKVSGCDKVKVIPAKVPQ